ncbi:endonuclease III domain-containing protein [Nitratifractor sp.]
MKREDLQRCFELLREEYPRWDVPAKRFEGAYRRTPYTILISTLLSFQTRDETTLEAGKRLFVLADTPEKMLELSREQIAETIYPVGFWRRKAASVLEVSRYLLDHHDGKVPDTLEALTAIRGIGPKTAKIVLEHAYGQEVLAVDTHVHRILNLLGAVNTASPQESDRELERLLPPGERRGLNRLLVSFGQAVCRPLAPRCEECPIVRFCLHGKK